MLIALMRHGEAESAAKTGKDFDCALSQKGCMQAEFIGKILVKKAILPKNVVCSPALRARQTLEALHLDVGTKTEFFSRLYHGNVKDYLSVIETATQNGFPLQVIGHNPTISLIVAKLCNFDDGSSLTLFLKPANLVLIDFPEDTKQQFVGKGHLVDVVAP